MYKDPPSPCTHLLFLLLAWAAFPRYGNAYFTFLALCDSIVHDVYIYIYACVCVGDCALCMMDSCDYTSDPL